MYISTRSLYLMLLGVSLCLVGVAGYWWINAHLNIGVPESINYETIEAELESGFEQKIFKALEEYKLGNECFEKKDHECSIKHFEATIESFPFPTAYLALGNAYAKEMRDKEAIDTYQIAIAKATANGNWIIESGARLGLLKLRDFLEATAKFRQ